MNGKERPRTPLAAILLLGALLCCAGPALAQSRLAEDNPRLSLPASRLNRDGEAPVFLTAHGSLGGAFQYDQGLIGYGASLVFRPGAAASFLDALEGWNAAMVLRIDYQKITGDGERLISGDLILRRYFRDRGGAEVEVVPFAGAGFGASDATLPTADGGGNLRNFSWLMEAGQEWHFSSDVLLVARVQYRRLGDAGRVVSAWSVSGAVGIPLPW